MCLLTLARQVAAMPSFPPPGAVTICEINRDLVAADALSDARAKEAYGDVLGMVFAPIPFQPEALLPSPRDPAAPAADQAEPAETDPAPAPGLVATISEFFRRMVFPPLDPNVLEEFDTQKVSWNPSKHCLAFVSGKNQVTIQDFEDSDAKEPCILTSDHQTDVKAVEWRPNSGKMIAVACKGGICLWSASYPANVPFMNLASPLLPLVPSLEVLVVTGYWWMFSVALLLRSSVHFVGNLMEDTWHLPHVTVRLSQFGMCLKGWELLYGVD